jgi:threonyl-tRNA synthetase
MADSNISYKALPMRVYELTRYSFRLEKAGELAGLRRLRAFTMPDMHTLCSDMEMSKNEFEKQFELCMECMEDLEIDEYEMAIRMTDEFWKDNKEFVLSLVKKLGRPILVEMWNTRFAYFDPKFEFNFVDSMGKAAALSTVQLDHENGKRFNVKYIDENSAAKHPFILHASPSGAIERVMYALLEKADMDEKDKKVPSLPVWLSPVQVRVIPLSDKFLEHAEKIMREIEGNDIRVDLDDRKEGVGKKVRSAELEWVPYIVVLGEREVESGKISLRERKSGVEEESTVKHLVDKIKKECGGKPFRKLSLPKKMSTRPTFGTV